MSYFKIRPAEFDELEALYCLHGIAVREREMPDQVIDLEEIKSKYPSSKANYERGWKNQNMRFWVAETSPFETKTPIYGKNGKQLAGFSSLRYNPQLPEKIAHIDDLFSVKSPYRTGTHMMVHTVKAAKEAGAQRIMLDALYPNAIDWYENKALFKFKHASQAQMRLGTMELYRESFDACINNLTPKEALAYEFKG